MTTLRTTPFRPIGHGIAEAELPGHPDPTALVRTRRATPDLISVGLWHRGDPGDQLMGSGELERTDTGWRGTCSEGKATWFLRGEDGAIVFSEREGE